MKTKTVGKRVAKIVAKSVNTKSVQRVKPATGKRLSFYKGSASTLNKKLGMLPKLASAKDKAGKPLSINAIVLRMMSTLTENEKNILRERYVALVGK